MCRHIGYLGPAVAVNEPLNRGASSLRVQSWAPKDMRGGGTINADGFGVAWWRDDVAAAARYRNPMPIWSDPAVDEVLSQINARGVLGAVRSATVGLPVERSACAPFTAGKWAFSHNGVVPRWRETLAALADDFGPVDLLQLEAATDSAALWLLLRTALESDDAEVALVELVGRVDAEVPGARLNLLLGDGEQLWATSYYHSLSVLVDEVSVTISSEPYDDNPHWKSVPDRSVVTASPGHVSIEPLKISR